jgi:type I restriction enzyme S subunit
MELGQICELIIDCEHKTAPTQDEGYPSIRTPNIGRGRFILEGVNRVSEETYRLWTRRAVPQPGDLIMAREAPVGNVAMVPPGLQPCLGQRTLLIRPDRSKAEPSFLNYFLNGPYVQGLIHSKTNGATVAHLNMKDVRAMELPGLPPLQEQRRVAGVLSAYDELIENSQRRIRILETMARVLYREWFVHFRFPGHENVPRVASPLGEIPAGWLVKQIGEVAVVFRGRSYRSVDLAQEGGLPFLNLKCLDRDGGFRRSGLKRYKGEYKSSHIARKGDIVIGVTDMTQERRIVARAALVPTLDTEFGIASMDLVRIEPSPSTPKVFLYSFLRYSSFSDEVKQHANGANVLHLSPERITDFQFPVPPVDLMRRFADFAASALEQMDTLEEKIENLRRTRDLLLPRLLSGQVPGGKPAGQSLRERLPRVFELKERLTDPLHPDAFFQNFEPSLVENQNKLTAFTSVERELAELDDAGWEDLKGRAADQLQQRDPVRGWQALWDTLGEAKGFVYLQRLGCTGVRFIPRPTAKGVKAPDLEGLRDARRVLCEVKTINTSKDEAERRKRMHEGEILATEVKTRLDDRFLGKLRSTLEHAVKQLDAQDPLREARRIVFTVVHFDDSLGEHQDGYFSQIDEDLSKNLVTGAELVFSPASNLFKHRLAMKSAKVFEFD